MRKTSPAWSFRGRNSQLLEEPVPGPGSYSPSQNHMETTPSFRIGTAERLNGRIKFSNPGPGNYDPLKPFQKFPNTV